MSAEASANFALNLLRENNNDKSFVYSPFSLGAALSIVHAGAQGSTQEEMTQCLLKGSNGDDVTAHYKKLITTLEESNGSDITVEVASKFFLREGIELKADYEQQVAKDFSASAETHDFNDADGAAATVNGYVDEKTHGKIKEIVKPDVFADAMAVLINAVYFKGMWNSPFNKDFTHEAEFHGIEGDRQESFMTKNDFKVSLNFDNDDFKAIGIPYKNEDYKMWFFLPKEGLPLKNWVSDITGEQLVEVMKNAFERKCNVRIPKFKIESSISAREQLENLGMKQIFSDSADLGNVCEVPLKVSDVIHKAVIEVNEKGARAAAVTAVIMTRGGRRPMARGPIYEFHATRPFAYAVNEEGAEAAAATAVIMMRCMAMMEEPEEFYAERPFAYAIAHEEDVLFLGTFH